MLTSTSFCRFVKSIVLTTFLVSIGGCAHDPTDKGSEPIADASIADDGAIADDTSSHDSTNAEDATRSDAPSTDAACMCGWDPDVGALIGMYTLECYCGRFGACPDYETALATCDPFESQLVHYDGCNLDIILYQENAREQRVALVYDATTHRLVGASQLGWSPGDTPSLPCGNRSVVAYRAGAYPWQWCRPMPSIFPCRQDAGTAGNASD